MKTYAQCDFVEGCVKLSQGMISIYSLTYAYKAKNILQKYGIQSTIITSSKDKLKGGCGYSLLVEGDIKNAQNILTQSGISYK